MKHESDSKLATVQVNGSEIVIRIQAPAAPESGDRLIRLDRKACQAEGLEVGGLKAKVDAGELPATTLGRSRYVRMSDILKLPKRLGPKAAPPAEGTPDADYEEMVASKRKKRAI